MDYRQIGDTLIALPNSSIPVSGTKATTGPTTLVNAPGIRKELVIDSLTLQNETDNAQTMLLTNGAGVPLQRYAGRYFGDGISRSNLGWHVGANQSLSLSISAAYQVGYTIWYHVEDANV